LHLISNSIKALKKYHMYFFGVLMLFLFSFKPQALTVYDYDIHMAGIKIGTMKATREIKDNGTITYSLSSNVSVYLLHRYHINDEVNCIYKNDILQSATINTRVDKKQYFSYITWNRDHYDIKINAYKYSKISSETTPVRYSVAKMYFDEPPASAKVFSEDYGVFSNITIIKPNESQLIFLGKKDKFNYVSGEMLKADMQSTIKDFIIRRR
jgi:hypothetical protein